MTDVAQLTKRLSPAEYNILSESAGLHMSEHRSGYASSLQLQCKHLHLLSEIVS